jgi:hypothetical protein
MCFPEAVLPSSEIELDVAVTRLKRTGYDIAGSCGKAIAAGGLIKMKGQTLILQTGLRIKT